MTLYELKIEKERAIAECFDEETGELLDADRLSKAFTDYNEKIENVLLYVKNLKAQANAIKTEKQILAERQRVLENKADRLEEYLQGALDGNTFECAKGKISYRKSEAVEIDLQAFLQNEDADDFLKYADPTPNKTEIKNAIKQGREFLGATIITKQNIQIK